ncbi:hypothetical protein ACIQUW_33110 [Streptomyces sp. NPDC101117]|uniref:hypothetical protein n=1 Tax=Streptomyces sp. NPDC101117 TaxID=3366108 RepID=UPI003828728D
MPNRYTDPAGDTVEETTTWEIEQGYQGRWSTCKYFDDHSEAVDWMERRRTNCPQENLRIVRVETTTLRTVEA